MIIREIRVSHPWLKIKNKKPRWRTSGAELKLPDQAFLRRMAINIPKPPRPAKASVLGSGVGTTGT